MSHVRMFCAAAALVLSLPAGLSAASHPITILIIRPTLVRNVSEASIVPIYSEVERQIRELFPCARVLTEGDIGTLLRNDRDVTVATANPGDLTEKLADLYRADLVVNMEFGSTGTTNNNPGRYMTTTMLDMQHSKAMTRNTSSGDGWQWSSKDFVEETMAPFRKIAYEICPWLGTIEYTRTANESADTQEKIVETDGVNPIVSVYSTKMRSHEEERFTFELTRNRLKPVTIETGGSATMTSAAQQQTEWTSKGCFPMDSAGVVRDTDYVKDASDLIVDKQSSEGRAQAPLLSPKVTLTLVEETLVNGVLLTVPTWLLSVEAYSSGTAEAKSVSERSGGCGAFSRINPEGTGTAPYGRLITFLLDSLKDFKGELAGKHVLVNTTDGREEVAFKLSRK